VVVAKVVTVKVVERVAAKVVTTLAHQPRVRPNRVKRIIVPKVTTLNQPGPLVSHVNPSRVRKPNLPRKQQSWLMHHARPVAKKNVNRGVVVDAAIAVRVMPVRKLE